MDTVGERLAKWAIAEPDLHAMDVFGRSAFNRYYYASFLITRSMLAHLDPAWGRMAHKDIPEVLENTVTKKIRKEAKKLSERNFISKSEESKYRTALNASVSEIASLMRRAYAVRVIADYKPECKVSKRGADFTLGEESISSARNWSKRITSNTKTLMKIWSDLGL